MRAPVRGITFAAIEGHTQGTGARHARQPRTAEDQLVFEGLAVVLYDTQAVRACLAPVSSSDAGAYDPNRFSQGRSRVMENGKSR